MRDKYRDDLSRNRELAAQGRLVLPVTSEDLFAPGGLDAVMLEAMMAIERIDGYSPDTQDLILFESLAMGLSRQTAIWALLPWPQGARYAADLARLRADRVGVRVHEEIIEF